MKKNLNDISNFRKPFAQPALSGAEVSSCCFESRIPSGSKGLLERISEITYVKHRTLQNFRSMVAIPEVEGRNLVTMESRVQVFSESKSKHNLFVYIHFFLTKAVLMFIVGLFIGYATLLNAQNRALVTNKNSVFIADSVNADTCYNHSDFEDGRVLDTALIRSIDPTIDTTCFDSLFVKDSLLGRDTFKADTSKVDTPITANGVQSAGVQKSESKQKAAKRIDYLYAGISHEQDRLALQMIQEVYAFNWDGADRIAKKMQKIEQHEALPPLSYLLMVSMRVVRIQDNECADAQEASRLLDETVLLAQEGMAKANPSHAPSTVKSTYIFIYSGIKGFSATLKIAKNPVEAAIEGLNALKLLEKLTELDPQIKDVYLGLGIFYCALAKAPAIVRGALNIAGRDVTFEKGIKYLQISAYEGRYTTETAKQYLIQFLSPYQGDQASEKKALLRNLQQSYPKNPYYLFLELNEDICFHREIIDKEYCSRIKKRLSKFKDGEYSIKRYMTLIHYQYSYLDSLSSVKPDTCVGLNEFSFYPVFLKALREKDDPEVKKRERFKKVLWSKNGAHAARLLDESSMSMSRKNFFAWYIRDALRSK